MIVVGLKFSHDGTVAAADDDKLLFSTEIEKLNNGKRYSKIDNMEQIYGVLEDEGLVGEQCTFVIDGWKSPIMEGRFSVAPYAEEFHNGKMIKISSVSEHEKIIKSHCSYTHVTGHILGSYCMSPFTGSPVNVLTWDGGQPLRLDHVVPGQNPVYIGQLMDLYSYVYGMMGFYYGPYKRTLAEIDTSLFPPYEWPGKLMSYCSFGKSDAKAINRLYYAYRIVQAHRVDAPRNFQQPEIEHQFVRSIYDLDISDEDKLQSIHTFLSEKLLTNVSRHVSISFPLIFTGGSALNINWNSALRSRGYNVWIPPVCNDTGSAIGQICCFNWQRGFNKLIWNVYDGPKLKVNGPIPGWHRSSLPAIDFGAMVNANQNKAFLCLHGRAELGPRALGHRSLFMSVEGSKDLLNKIKKREAFRPVAPIVMEEHAGTYFDPGTPDPFMLFNHQVKHPQKTPAICHIDRTARIQTVGLNDCPVTYDILKGAQRTGLPMLCNTSANVNGSGFFDSVESAVAWANENGVTDIWSHGILYKREQ